MSIRWFTRRTPSVVAFVACGALALASFAGMPAAKAGVPASDEHTVLLDHFDGSTVGSDYGSLSFAPSQAGLGQAGVFGTGTYVKYAMAPSTTNTGTVEMWVRPTSGLTTTTGLLNFNWNDTTSLPPTGWVLQMLISSSSTLPPNVLLGSTATGSRSIPLNRWSHLALTWSPTSTKLYLNGVLTGSGAGSPPSIAQNYWVYLNYWGTAQSGPFVGLIDELRISDTERSAAEIAADALTSSAISYKSYDIRGALYTHVSWVNNKGVIAGYYGDTLGVRHGFIDNGKKVVTFVEPASSNFVVTSINDSGVVTGAYWLSGKEYGFIRSASGAFTTLDNPGATGDGSGTFANQINNSGVVVGSYFTTDAVNDFTLSHGFTWTGGGGFTTYDAPDAATAGPPGTHIGTWLTGINTAGDEIGYDLHIDGDLGLMHGFALSGASFHAFYDPDSHLGTGWCGETHPNSINDYGTIVGTAFNGCGGWYGSWMLVNGSWIDLTYTKGNVTATKTVVGSINNNGLIGGTWTSADNREHGFIAH